MEAVRVGDAAGAADNCARIAPTRARTIYSLAASGSVVASAAGVYLSLSGGAELGAWQVTCLGVGIPAAILAVLIGWHLPQNRIAWVFATAGAMFGLELLSLVVLQHPGAPARLQTGAAWALELGAGPLTTVWVLLILLFPDGHFLSGTWKRLAGAATASACGAATLQWLVSPPGFLPASVGLRAPGWIAGPLARAWQAGGLAAALNIPQVALPVLATTGLLERFRRSSVTVRQQIKWLLYAVALNVLFEVFASAATTAGVKIPALATLIVAPLPTLGAAIAILRYRLWEIDRLVARTVAFAVLWVASTGVFVALAIAVGISAGGPDRRLYLAVALAVLVALLVQPLRSRLEQRISRLVYGGRPSGYAALAGLKPVLEGEMPLRDMAPLVAEIAIEALGAPWAGVWLRVESEGREVLRLAGAAGDERARSSLEGEPALFEAGLDVAPAGALPGGPQFAAPLLAGDERIGVLACGVRPGEAVSDDRRELLAIVARQSALVLRNARLEGELRQRLSELRESRQRLVGAQDEERRKLERDLHDGVQQQLVTLAARLREASVRGRERTKLASLADQAEEAVFALQDLARGIYPAVLADRGLAEALRAHAARVPLRMRVEVQPQLAGVRYQRDIEAGLYFVALEAIANATKHAGASNLTVALRSESSGRHWFSKCTMTDAASIQPSGGRAAAC